MPLTKVFTQTEACGEAWDHLHTAQACIPVGDTVHAEVWWKVLGTILFRKWESLSQGSTKNKTGSGMFVLVLRSPECY